MNPFATTTEIAVLKLLCGRSIGMYGLELLRASDNTIKRGTIHVLLGRLRGRGLVSSYTPKKKKKKKGGKPKKAAHPGLPRPLYRITAAGEAMVKAYDLLRCADHPSTESGK